MSEHTQGVTMVDGDQRREFTCPLWHSIIITGWAPGVTGRHDAHAWAESQIKLWHERNRIWKKTLPLRRYRVTRWLHEYLQRTGRLIPPGPRQNILLSDCAAGNFEINHTEGVVAVGLMVLGPPHEYHLSIGNPADALKPST